MMCRADWLWSGVQAAAAGACVRAHHAGRMTCRAGCCTGLGYSGAGGQRRACHECMQHGHAEQNHEYWLQICFNSILYLQKGFN